MTEEKKKGSWWDRVRSTRMAMEGILFEKEVFSQFDSDKARPPKMGKGLLGILILVLFQSVLLTQWLIRDERPLSGDESLHMHAVMDSLPSAKAGKLMPSVVPDRNGARAQFAGPTPPLYYWSLAQAVRIFSGNPKLGTALTNSFYSGLVCLFVFLIVRRDRSDPSGWLAACFISCVPFMLEMSRRISPDIACVAWVAGAYACYVWSSDFERKWWSYGFGICCAAGFLTDLKFLFYVLVLAPVFFKGLLVITTQRNCITAAVIVAVVNVPWYWANFVSFLTWFLTPLGSHLQTAQGAVPAPASVIGTIFWHLWGSINSLYLPFFLIGIFSMVWMLAAEFMPYSRRRFVFLWLAVPYIIWSIFPDKDVRYFFPAIVAFAPAVGIMSPPKIRKALAGLFLLFAASHQLGLLSPRIFMFRNHVIPVVGSAARPMKENWKHGDMIRAINSAAGPRESRQIYVAVDADEPFLNAQSLSWSAVKSGCGNLSFRRASNGVFGLSEFVLRRSTSGTPALPGWFSRGYRPVAVFDLPDASDAVLYQVRKMDGPPLISRSYRVSRFSSGDLRAYDVSIRLGPWDRDRRAYSYAVVYCPSISIKGLDIYGLKVRLENFVFVPVDPFRIRNIRFLSIERIKVLSGNVTEYSVKKFLSSNVRGLKNFRVRFGDWIFFTFSCGFLNISGILEAYLPESSILQLRIGHLTVGGLGLPAFLFKPYAWTFRLNRVMNVPFELELRKLSVNAGALKFGK